MAGVPGQPESGCVGRAVCAARQAGWTTTKISPMVLAMEGIRALASFG